MKYEIPERESPCWISLRIGKGVEQILPDSNDAFCIFAKQLYCIRERGNQEQDIRVFLGRKRENHDELYQMSSLIER